MAFSLVPLSQIVLYFSVINFSEFARQRNNIQRRLNMDKVQLSVFQVISILFFSIVSFLFMYLIDWLILKLFSKKLDHDALFIALALAIGLGNIAEILVFSVFNKPYPQVAAMTKLLVISEFYYLVSTTKDKTGSIILGTVTVLLNVIPAFW